MSQLPNDQIVDIESRPERREIRDVPSAVLDRYYTIDDAVANLSSVVNLQVNEGPAGMDNEVLGETIKNIDKAIDEHAEKLDTQQPEIHDGSPSDLSEIRRRVATAYPSDVEQGIGR